jgi:copper chaperone NosL
MKSFLGISILTLLLVTSCKVEPEQINYGKDGCHFCKMTIVDNQHAAQLVTAKGKVYKYDAIECLINDLKKRDSAEVGMLLVNDYSNPGALISAESATFIISEGIPSPMGAFLSGFSTKEAAEKVISENGGTLYNWQTVRGQIK